MPEESSKPIISTQPIRTEDDDFSSIRTTKSRKKTPKKVVYLEIDDEITMVYDRLKNIKTKNIYLVVPKRAILFQSFINLKILKRTAEDLNKNIYIITNDPNGLHLASRIGLPVYDKLENQEHPSLVSGALTDDQKTLAPLKASINTLNDDTPVIRKEKKLSISELLERQQQGVLWWILRQFEKINVFSKKFSSQKKEKGKFILVAPNRHALLALIVISIFVLITITYIALPGATIRLTPKSTILSHNINVVLADTERNQAELDLHPINMIPSYTITTKVPKIFRYTASGEEFKGEHAQGQLTVFNENTTEQPLRAGTRFQTPDGIVFRTDQAIRVPPARNGEPGKLTVQVKADEKDANNVFIGERGNIPPTRFFLPGLSEESRKKVYAISTEPFIGGKTSITKRITADDLRQAREKMLNELKASAQVELESYLKTKNESQKTNLALVECKTTMSIPCDQVITLDNIVITIPSDLEGQAVESFEVQGEAIATGMAYNRDELLRLLTNELKKYVSPQKRLYNIDPNTLNYDIIDVNKNTGKITITAVLKGIEEFEIRPTEENGKRFIKTIRDHVAGKDLKEAELFIQNLPEVEKVEIENWPGWSPNLPSVAGNITIEIKR